MNRVNITSVTVAAGLSLLCVSHATAQNLIINGGFSSGNLSGWTQTPTAPTTITYDGTEV